MSGTILGYGSSPFQRDLIGGGTGSPGLDNAGEAFAWGGAVSSVMGAFYQASANRYQAKSLASQLRFQESMAGINARNAELDAQQSIRASQRAAGQSDLQYRAVLAQSRVSQAQGGIQAGVGSAGEVSASIKYAQQSDRISITANGARAARDSRIRKMALRNRADSARTQAQTTLLGASLYKPWMSGLQAGFTSAGQLVGSYARSQREERYYQSRAGYSPS